ncbi:MAG: SWIM zinc finger domain-containing protein [Thermoflexales bacterium]|nr:SWIM zinc finger domain-containing protein [Thermoflexales bacterium]
MAIPSLNEVIIRQQATDQSFQRGRDYYRSGAVGSLVQRGSTIQAEVEGSQCEPYHVALSFDAGGITGAYCNCPYDWGGWCKHIVAVLLACLHEPASIQVRPPMEEALTGLGRDQLQTVLLKLAEAMPGAIEAIENHLDLLRPAPPAQDTPQARRTSVDPRPIRRQVRSILGSLDHLDPSAAYWHVGDVVNQVRQMLDQVRDFIEGEDGNNALLILEVITDEYIRGWTGLDGSDGSTGAFFDELGPLWTEVILTADLSAEEREAWVWRLEEWRDEVSAYGVDDVFEAAQAAVEQGWDYSPLQRVLHGEITRQGAWEGEVPDCADDLAQARLKVLERQERWQEYLYLAEAEGQMDLYLAMLARVGDVQRAVDESLRYLSTPGEALTVAKALREREELISSAPNWCLTRPSCARVQVQ